MTQSQISDIMNQSIWVIFLVSLPLLGIGLILGIIISVLQATTQINEQTIVFVVKILSVFAALIIFGSWILTELSQFTIGVYESILLILRT